MRSVCVAGTAMTAFGKYPDRGVRSLAEEAVTGALADAGAGINEVGMVFFGNAASGLVTRQECIRGQVALRRIGLAGTPVVNVENACASGSTAVNLAWLAVASGQCDVALAVGAEKLTHPDKTVTFKAMESAVDQEELAEIKARIGAEKDGASRSMFMDVYAEMTKQYMARTGATARDFAQVAVKNHHAGALNPKAQYRDEVTVEEVLGSRPISPPLTLLMCSPIGDGAAAVVLASEEWARRHGKDAVKLRASVLVSGAGDGDVAPGATRAARKAFEIAGIGPEELHVVELHDATAPAELFLYEEIGLCAEGDGPRLLGSGATALGGRMPVNPSGGLLSKGHPVGATGCAQLVELTDQLRERCGHRQRPGARVALMENGGGFVGRDLAAAAVMILSR
ncbi:MAG: thiolase [Candidatus Rokubacteria bacterium GWC2_70_16]|nr:MAG: thiolase [Candidatus Rokubacteria bacterium GWC2_70_16]